MAARMQKDSRPARDIGEVIERLDRIVASSIIEKSRLGYFPALYRKVTLKVKEGIATGRFQDGPRMERLDVTFANRYLHALDQYRDGERPSACWLLAFEAARRWRPIILQHLLLGMNAHINFDLGIAAAATCPGSELPPLKHDFDEINKILAGLVNRVEDEVNEVSPFINFLDHIDPSLDDAIINFSMERARQAAWEVAVRLAPLPQDEWGPELERLDRGVTAFGRFVYKPPSLLLKVGLLVIRLPESNNISRVIEVLNQVPTKNI
jgi:hypothetical protein